LLVLSSKFLIRCGIGSNGLIESKPVLGFLNIEVGYDLRFPALFPANCYKTLEIQGTLKDLWKHDSTWW